MNETSSNSHRSSILDAQSESSIFTIGDTHAVMFGSHRCIVNIEAESRIGLFALRCETGDDVKVNTGEKANHSSLRAGRTPYFARINNSMAFPCLFVIKPR